MIINEDAKRIGNNIRIVREAYGLLQYQLADLIHVASNSLSQYELGIREIDDDKLKDISRVLLYPFDELKYGSVTGLKKNSLRFSPKNFNEHLTTFFPIITSEEPNKKCTYSQAQFFHKRVFERIKEEGVTEDSLGLIEECINLYEKARKENQHVLECAANLIGLYLYQISLIVNLKIVIQNGDALKTISKQDRSVAAAIDTVDSLTQEELNEINEWFVPSEVMDSPEYKSILKYLLLLRKTKEYCDLSYYYLALMYVFKCYFYNDYSEDFNTIVGAEMMYSFSTIGNPYAKQMLESSIKLHSV